MYRNQSVNTHQFAMIPRSDIPRSTFRQESSHKTTFDGGFLIPIYVNEVLPGDSMNLKMNLFARLATPINPIMHNMYLDTFFFFVPNRLVWNNWVRMMGERDNPDDSIDFITPQMTSPVGGYAPLSIHDYFGLPTVGQLDGSATFTHLSLFHRAYNLIWNEWFRDQNLQDSAIVDKDDGPDNPNDYVLRRRGKRHDYFTAALPFAQKGPPVSVPLGSTAPIVSSGSSINIAPATTTDYRAMVMGPGPDLKYSGAAIGGNPFATFGPNGTIIGSLFVNLNDATSATINTLRQAFTIQQLLEKDARGGTRYTEQLRVQFGVTSPDARLQRPEYLGGGSNIVNINPIAQTSGTGGESTTPQGNLAAMGTALVQNNGFNQSFTEHGMIIGLAAVRADLTYQQGVRKMWKRRTRYDYYTPVFANLGEQAVLNYEIYARGTAQDNDVFGYQERWGEYRYTPSMITGLFKSTTAQAIDQWHLAQHFTSLPTLNEEFIEDKPPIDRVVAVGPEANGQQFICDSIFINKTTRMMPMYSVPGLGKL